MSENPNIRTDDEMVEPIVVKSEIGDNPPPPTTPEPPSQEAEAEEDAADMKPRLERLGGEPAPDITPEEFARAFSRLIEVVRNLSLLAGFCYTQFADTYQEANGLLHADRTPKFPLHEIARAVAGRAAIPQGGLTQLQAATTGPSEVR